MLINVVEVDIDGVWIRVALYRGDAWVLVSGRPARIELPDGVVMRAVDAGERWREG